MNTDKVIEKTKAGKVSQKKLTKFVKKNKDRRGREAAVEKLTDQTLLSDVAKDKGSYFRMTAADKLNDKSIAQEVYTDVAKNDNTGTYAKR